MDYLPGIRALPGPLHWCPTLAEACLSDSQLCCPDPNMRVIISFCQYRIVLPACGGVSSPWFGLRHHASARVHHLSRPATFMRSRAGKMLCSDRQILDFYIVHTSWASIIPSGTQERGDAPDLFYTRQHRYHLTQSLPACTSSDPSLPWYG